MPTGGPAVQARRGWVVPWDGAEFGAEQDEGLETRELTSSLELTGRTVWPPQGLSDAGGGRAAWEALWLVQGTSWVCGCPLRCHVGTCLHHSPPKQGLSQRHPAGRKSPQVPVVWGERTQSERQVLHQQQQGQPRGSQGGGAALASGGQTPPPFSFEAKGKIRLLGPSKARARTPLARG